jgi:serine/threonine protein kinase/CRP-like cAMP-binding protein
VSSSEFSGPSKVATNAQGASAMQMPMAFGRYELLQLLAVGGMAEVFLARSRQGGIERKCVIKRVLPRYSTSRQFVSMFIDEARITIGLDHENIVRLFDFGQVDGAYYMALEYVEGCDLVDVLRAQKARGEGIPPPVAAYVARHTLRGLNHAHALADHRGRPMGIVHRDVSPQNVFLGWNGVVKIGDFGIADARNKLTRTLHGTVKGKFSYMSPEQATGQLLDGRSDVWALGVVLWEMLVGGRLFAGDNPVDTMSRVMEAPIIRPSEMRSSVPPELDRIVLHSLTRKLDDRYPTAKQMADDLDAFLATNPCSAEQLSSFLGSLDLKGLADETRLRGSPVPVVQDGATVALPDDAELRRQHLELRKEKNLWTLVDIAERHAELGEATEALSAARTAAAIFAHRGLVVPAICALHSMRTLMTDAEMRADLEGLASLRAHDRSELRRVIAKVDKGGFFEHVQDADPSGLGAEKTEETVLQNGSPLFGKVTPADFVRLAAVAVVEERPAGSVLVDEGDRGDCLYAIGRGRVLVHCKAVDDPDNPATLSARIYVAALAEGDFFGEFSLLTRSPRSATVEAATDVILLRIDRESLDGLLLGDASFREPLVDFYKERVAELLLARNPLVSTLSPESRRRLLVKSEVQRFKNGQLIVQEGQEAGAVFFVMGGEVEVFHDEDGFPVFIDKLREGQLFGEMAALRRGTRSASVSAIGEVELLAIDGTALADVLSEAPDVRVMFEQAMNTKAREAQARIAETARIFEGV